MLQIETKNGPVPAILFEHGYSDTREWKIFRLVNERGQSATLDSMARQSGRLSTLDFKRKKIHARFCLGRAIFCLGSPDLDLYIGANEPLSKFVPAGVLHRDKVFPREMSSAQPNPPSFISKLNKTAGHDYIDTPGTVYLEVFVDSPQGCIVLSFSFAGAAVQKTKEPADT